MNKQVGLYIKNGWKSPTMFYQFKCPIHGMVINYPQGYDKRLERPICLLEHKKDMITK